MDPTQFCYWLNGFFELSGSEKLSKEQVKIIKQHLALVFTKVTGPNTNVVNLPYVHWWQGSQSSPQPWLDLTPQITWNDSGSSTSPKKFCSPHSVLLSDAVQKASELKTPISC